jgi:hypothetical protein
VRTLPTNFWELEDFNCKVLSITYIVQLTRLLDVLPVDLHLGRIQDHSQSSAKADGQQKGKFLFNHVDGEHAASALECYWDFCRQDELRGATNSSC